MDIKTEATIEGLKHAIQLFETLKLIEFKISKESLQELLSLITKQANELDKLAKDKEELENELISVEKSIDKIQENVKDETIVLQLQSIRKSISQTTEKTGWVLTEIQKPNLGDDVEWSNDGMAVEGTMKYTDRRHCILSYSSNFGHDFGIGFATDGKNEGAEAGLICDDPKYWRYYDE